MRLMLIAALALSSTVALAHHPDPAPAAAPADRTATEAGVAVDAFHAALGRGDTDAALALLTNDALIFEEGQAERSKAEYAGHHLGADAEFSKAVPSKLLGRTARGAGDFAWVASERRVTGTFRGKAMDRQMTETMVLRRDKDRWLITHIHWSSAAAH